MKHIDPQSHWETVYQTKTPEQTSWFRPHLETSLVLIQRAAPDRSASIMDVGGGESTLVDDLLSVGYSNIAVLDVAHTALEHARIRIGPAAQAVQWLVGDVTQISLPRHSYDVWHDRAVFHFLTLPAQRAAYVRQVVSALKPGGHMIIATFGPEGPQRCSGLDVVRYDAPSLLNEFGAQFRLVESLLETHQTPFGTAQQFLYCSCVLK
jgi:2-polyprenyl-3-methyl-5-hydroxy-6-metoxy-1,4-benzoquinol methylase